MPSNRRWLCRIGWHNMRRGFGWSMNHRTDICMERNCSYTAVYEDRKGCKEMQTMLMKHK